MNSGELHPRQEPEDDGGRELSEAEKITNMLDYAREKTRFLYNPDLAAEEKLVKAAALYDEGSIAWWPKEAVDILKAIALELEVSCKNPDLSSRQLSDNWKLWKFTCRLTARIDGGPQEDLTLFD